jgi:hypothetical protein
MYSVPSLYHAAVCASTRDNTQNMRLVVSEEMTWMGPVYAFSARVLAYEEHLFRCHQASQVWSLIRRGSTFRNQPSRVESQVPSMVATMGPKDNRRRRIDGAGSS